ncbi:MAG TPA: hypothetical protein VGL24_13275 [Chthoniobacterales bacterium]
MLAIVIAVSGSLVLVGCLLSVRPGWTMLLTIASLLLVSTGRADQASKDIYRYDVGGIVEIDPMISGAKAVEGVAKLRGFLWKHWIEHKRGLIVTVGRGVDSGSSTTSYFVEPNALGGDWRIVIEFRRNPHTNPDATIQRFVAYDLKRIEPTHDGWSKRVEIPSDAARRPQTYMLSLKDQRGDFLDEF